MRIFFAAVAGNISCAPSARVAGVHRTSGGGKSSQGQIYS